MNQVLKSLDYFKYNLDEPFFEVEVILKDTDHICHKNLLYDFQHIDKNALDAYVRENDVDKFLGRWEDKDKGRRSWFLITAIQNELATQKLNALADIPTNTVPFTLSDGSNVEILKDGLVSTENFSVYNAGYRHRDHIYQLSPSTPAANSSYWISMTINQLIVERNLKFKIRLDPFIEIHHESYCPMMYKMIIYGVPLDWERLRTLKNDEFGRWMEDDQRQKTSFTDYAWHPMDKEIHFTCEELPRMKDCRIRGSRYFHAIFEKATGLIRHCDGAVRVYTEYELEKRLKFHIRNPEVRKVGRRAKIFQLDHKIDQETFALLFANFMVWNYDAIKYFN